MENVGNKLLVISFITPSFSTYRLSKVMSTGIPKLLLKLSFNIASSSEASNIALWLNILISIFCRSISTVYWSKYPNS